ncbi:MAG: peptidoglycan DD-metalloendopeptidase family protein [Candidatus Puniceispirillales bacterium]
MLKLHLIIIAFFMFGCQTNNLVEGIKSDYAPETKALVFNKYEELIKNNIPLNGMIMVKENETIYSIANKYNVIPKDIIEDNKLSKPYNLKFNQILFLRNKNFYVLKRGDTINKISIRFAVNKIDIIELNKLKKPYKLIAGNKILIPRIKDYSVVDLIINEKVYKSKLVVSKFNKNNKNLIKNSPKFIWPAKGTITKSFGKFGKGQHYDGIDIKLGENKPIYSSHDGKIAFIGSQIKKFGNLILINHDNGWLSAYSNLGKYNVKQGDTIKKGQVIAYTSAESGSFHFQLRYNRTPINPINYLN